METKWWSRTQEVLAENSFCFLMARLSLPFLLTSKSFLLAPPSLRSLSLWNANPCLTPELIASLFLFVCLGQQPQHHQQQHHQQQPQPQTQKGQSGPFISQRSPLFGQEFPSLTGTAEGTQTVGSETGSPSPPPGSKVDHTKYGPGPSLRPQSFSTWSFSGGKQGHQGSNNHNDKEGHHGETKGSSPPLAFEPRGRNIPESGGLKFDVGVNSPLLQQGSAPFKGRKTSSTQRNQHLNKNAPSSAPVASSNSNNAGGSNARGRENLFQGTIIDSEKLKRMDDIDSNDDDWTRKDDSFDYNKRIDRLVKPFLTLFPVHNSFR